MSSFQSRFALVCHLALLLVLPSSLPAHSWASEVDGATIYAHKCAQCHGAQGQGTEAGYSMPLVANKATIAELTKLVEETMPEEAPEECVGEEAAAVARFIADELYSLNDHEPPQVARLTVAQYRNALADCISRFSPSKSEESEPVVPGLKGEYFQSRGMNKADKLGHYRSDTSIKFDFGTGSPVPSISPDQFAIIWKGGLIAKDTGYYEFRISTQNGARLYLNIDPDDSLRRLRDDSSSQGQQALIDAWVSSGEMRVTSARIFLLGGRKYPLRIEFFKYLEETSSVHVEWKPPHAAWRTLDYNDVETSRPVRTFVCDVPFPADDRSLGFERGNSASPEWQSAVTDGAIAAANEIIDRLPTLAKIEVGDEPESWLPEEHKNKIDPFVLSFAEAAFRRPLATVETELIQQLLDEEPTPYEARVRKSLVFTLLSPHFLYVDLEAHASPHAEQGPNAQFASASKLAFALWDSIPDQELLNAAKAGRLDSAKALEQHARRMIRDDRTQAKVRSFFHHWLELDERDLAKDKQLFPNFDDAVVADLRRSLQEFVDQVIWSRDSDYRELLTANYLLLNDRLTKLYSSEPPDEKDSDGQAIKRKARSIRFGSSFQPVDFPKHQRAGVLTHPYLLSAQAYHNNTSPIHRGVFLTRNIVGRSLSPPPVAVAFKDEEFDANLTMREKITELTRDEACRACHSVINPLGFALENFDAVGRWRTLDNEKPVNSQSEYTTASGENLKVSNARDIAEFAVKSPLAHHAFVAQVFQHVAKRSPLDFPEELLTELTQEFEKENFNVQKLWANVATTVAKRDDDEQKLAITEHP